MKKFVLLISALLLSLPLQAQVPQKTPPPMKLGEPLPRNLFVELAKIINPAVVNISTSAMPQQRRQRDPLLDMLEEFYGIPSQPRGPNRPQQQALGTGFIVREDGLIITNAHVVEGADTISVSVQASGKTEKTYEATVIGADRRTDIALLKIEGEKFPVAALGSSKDLEVGEWVAAFGNPYGHGHSMTVGVISSKGREIGEINKFPLLQTDASINPGNSGGPLVDTRGYVIGVNSAIDARAQGIGFAIPIDDVKEIVAQLESRGKVQRGYIGASLGTLDEQSAAYLGVDGGAVIAGVEPNGPAYKAGIRLYDLIVEFNGKKVKNHFELIDAVGDAPVGKDAKVKVLRNNKTLNLTVRVAERPNEFANKPGKPGKKANNSRGLQAPHNLGFSVTDLDDRARKEWGFPAELEKPIVVETERGSIASKAGLRMGDIILDVNKEDVITAQDVIKALKKGKNTMRVARANRIYIITF